MTWGGRGWEGPGRAWRAFTVPPACLSSLGTSSEALEQPQGVGAIFLLNENRGA